MVSGMCKSLLLLAAALRSDAVSAAEDFSAARSCPVETDFAKDLETTFVQKQLIVRSKLAEERERERERERESQSRRNFRAASTGSMLRKQDLPLCLPCSSSMIPYANLALDNS